MKTKLFGGLFGSSVSLMGLTISTEQLEQIISIVCSVLGVIIVIFTSIIIPLINWYKNAKKDGKISKEELKEGNDIIKDGIDQIKDKNKGE